MNLFKQIALTLVLLVGATVAAARYYPGAYAILNGWGVPEPLLAMVSSEGNASSGAAGERRGRGPRVAVVTTATVSTGAINTVIQAIGSSEAVRSVSVVPLDAGALTQVAVHSGDLVAAGDLLAQMNADSEQIARDRAAVALKIAESSYSRYERLSRSSAASLAELETLLSERDDASLALREAEVALAQRSIFAPIGGFVDIVPVELGDYVTTGTPIALIDDRSQVTVDFWMPERVVGLVAIGQPVVANSLALPGSSFEGVVSALGSRVETGSRTLRVRALIDNAEDRLRPGMSFSVSMAFGGQTYLAVDPLAVLWDANGSYVWQVAEGIAKRIPAQIVQRNADMVLIDADMAQGAQVVIEGALNVRDGAKVVPQGEVKLGGNATDERPAGPRSPSSEEAEG